MREFNQKHTILFQVLIRGIDVLSLILAGELASLIHFQTSVSATTQVQLMLLYLCGLLSFIGFEKAGIYRSWRGRRPVKMIINIAASWASVLLVGLFFTYLIHRSNEISRLWLFYWFLLGSASLIAVRWIIYAFLRSSHKNGRNLKRVVIVGYGSIGEELHRRAETQNWFGYEVVGVYAEEKDRSSLHDTRVQVIRSLDELPKFAENNHVNEIWIALSINAATQPQKLQYLLRNVLVDIRWIPDLMSISLLSSDMIDFFGFPTVDLNRPISGGLSGLGKDVFDRLFASTVLIFLLPIFLVIAIAIKRDSPGPIFFRQYRHGLNGKLFRVYKFRTMKLHSDQAELQQATKEDARITTLGKWMRRTSVDELPQFLNVFLGDMSIVGPRPHALQHNNQYKSQIDLYMLRHRVKPGITGWAQIHGLRGETDTLEKMAERIKFDLYYIRHWTFFMDLKIILWTAFKGWTGNNAY